VPSGVAVVADGFWAALQGRLALEVEWDAGPNAQLDSRRLRTELTRMAESPGLVVRDDGDFEAALEGADQVLEAVYEVPFLAHAPMEPLSCMVELREGGGAHVVTGSQFLGIDHPHAAAALGVDPSQVTFENSYLGGGFGRRANPAADFTVEAIHVALAAKDLGAPVKTVWTREDDLRGGWYRPLWVNGVKAAVKDGQLVAWRHRIVGQSIAAGTAFEGAMVTDGVDHTSVEGAYDMPHGVPNLRVELSTVNLGVPVQWWRSVGHSNTAFAKECFLDECAHAVGKDGYAFRRELLAGHERLLAVLDRAAEASGWSDPLPAGVGRGIAVHESFKGFAAHVVEASVVDGRAKVHRVVVAIDCGLVVNPDQVRSQMQGAAIFALSSVDSAITLTNGRVDQSNFHDYPIVRMDEAPPVEVHLVDTGGEMGGIGEVGVPGVAPALCAALFQACGRRIRRLPIGD
ncbi:MAG TPA: molybdopterin cofactor-binding domain-containing protein, partial [Planctomycetota bacterium]|nr:molybdopterin cofactor-binding domain-containing protein [Planctomycetota bacterium]